MPRSRPAARAGAERTRAAIESTYWLPERVLYAFATVAAARHAAGRGARARRANGGSSDSTRSRNAPARRRGHGPARGAAVVGARSTRRAPSRRSIASAAARWPPTGAHRILSTGARSTIRSRTTTGRSGRCSPAGPSMAAYRYGRPHVGYQALMANALLTDAGALGVRHRAAVRRLQRRRSAARRIIRSGRRRWWSRRCPRSARHRDGASGGIACGSRRSLPANWDRVERPADRRTRWTRRRRDHACRRCADDRDGRARERGPVAGRVAGVAARRRDRPRHRRRSHGKGRRDPYRDVQFAEITIVPLSRRAATSSIPLSRRQRCLRAGACARPGRPQRRRPHPAVARRCTRVAAARRRSRRPQLPSLPADTTASRRGRRGDARARGGTRSILRVGFDGPDGAYARREVVVSLR